MSNTDPLPAFRDMGLAPPLLEALQEVGYEAPTHSWLPWLGFKPQYGP